MKEIIAKINNVDNSNNIKILFAGKDLLNNIILDRLEIGNSILFAYIRSTEDIFLMTAKALQINKSTDEYEYEYEED